MARRKGRRYKWTILPVVSVPILFLVVPIIFFQVYFSLHQWTAYLGEWWQADFVGLDNFRDVLGESRFYLLFITPMLIVPVAIGYVFEMLLVQKGPLNQLLSWLTGQEIQVAWFAEAVPAFVSIIFIEVWNWTPFVFILMLAGLASMPKEPIEAARVLGASPLQIFFHVQVPLLRPVIFLALILRFLEALGEYPKVWSLTRGGPGSYTETMPVYLFITSWEHFNISKGAAMSYLVLLVVAVIVYLCIRLLLREKRTLEMLYGR